MLTDVLFMFGKCNGLNVKTYRFVMRKKLFNISQIFLKNHIILIIKKVWKRVQHLHKQLKLDETLFVV